MTDKFPITVFHLKILAMVSMFTDHAAYIFVNTSEPLYLVMRGFGRLAFPIYCFLLVEGFYHTRNIKKYIMRLGLFALISEVPFDLAFANRIYDLGHQNTIVTLLIGMIMIAGMDYFKKQDNGIMEAATMIGACLLSLALKTDYDVTGILMIIAFYEFRNKKMIQLLAVSVLGILSGGLQVFGVLAFVPILAYGGEKGRGGLKYFFYLFYPGHLLLLYGIRLLGYF